MEKYECWIKSILFNLSWNTVDRIYINSTYAPIWWAKEFLALHQNYSTPYTPEYAWSPATKKYVDDNVVQKSATAPSSPTEWMVWYDTTNDQLKVYDWTNWNVTGKEYNAREWISIGNITINWRKWPCPDGFHVPVNTEWQAVYDAWTTLWWWSNDWTNFWISLKLPFAGRRINSGSDVSYVWTYGLYWSSKQSSSNYAYQLRFNSSQISS